MSTDFVPPSDAAYADFFSTLSTYVSANYAALGLTGTQSAAFAAAYDNWNTAWTAWQDMQNQYNAALATKDAAQDAGTAQIRLLNALVQANPAVTDAQREAAGLPVHKTSRTPTPVPETYPVLYRVDNEHLLQRLWFSDESTPGSKAKPKGVGLCEIRQSLLAPGGTAPTDPAAMPLLAMDTKSPHRTDFETGDLGRTAYYAARWINTAGDPGPWGLITSYTVV